jgi:hypothetical protein
MSTNVALSSSLASLNSTATSNHGINNEQSVSSAATSKKSWRKKQQQQQQQLNSIETAAGKMPSQQQQQQLDSSPKIKKKHGEQAGTFLTDTFLFNLSPQSKKQQQPRQSLPSGNNKASNTKQKSNTKQQEQQKSQPKMKSANKSAVPQPAAPSSSSASSCTKSNSSFASSGNVYLPVGGVGSGDVCANSSVNTTNNNKNQDIRARYWAYLFDNLKRAVDEIYQTCENDEEISECKV